MIPTLGRASSLPLDPFSLAAPIAREVRRGRREIPLAEGESAQSPPPEGLAPSFPGSRSTPRGTVSPPLPPWEPLTARRGRARHLLDGSQNAHGPARDGAERLERGLIREDGKPSEPKRTQDATNRPDSMGRS